MIDLHCHMLPGIDDGAADLETSLDMARIAVSDGITMTACTPHIYPGLFENTGEQIKRDVEALKGHLLDAEIPLDLTHGADIQIVPEMLHGLQTGHMPTLHGTRYFLFEPPHHTVPPHFTDQIFNLVASGYVPVITHPERLTWLDDEHFPWFVDAVRIGAWIQLTAGAVTGRFGRRPKYWSEKFLDEGLVHILATDAHEPTHRPPLLAEAREAAAVRLGPDEANLLVFGRPHAIIDDADPGSVAAPAISSAGRSVPRPSQSDRGWFGRFFSRK